MGNDLPKKVAAATATPNTVADDDGYSKAIEYIKLCEDCNLKVYDDGYGYPTQGWGNRYRSDGSAIQFGDPDCTQEQADQWFESHFRGTWEDLEQTIPNWEKLHSGQRAAIADLAYNDGYDYRDDNHDGMDEYLASGKDFAKVLLRYCKANGKPVLGLSRRRLGAAFMAKNVAVKPRMAYDAAWKFNTIEDINNANLLLNATRF